MITLSYYESPFGKMGIAASGQGITHVWFGENPQRTEEVLETSLHRKANEQLQEYFNGKRQEFDLPLTAEGTEFQKKVWEALNMIPYGEVVTYKDIAELVDSPKAFRAVGSANGKNPIPIIVPCHRVISCGNKLGGYAYGLEMKERLLELEGVTL